MIDNGEDDDESGEHASEGWETEGMSSGYMCTADKGRAIFPSREKACRSTDSDRLKEAESWTSGRKAKRASWGHQSRFESVRFDGAVVAVHLDLFSSLTTTTRKPRGSLHAGRRLGVRPLL
jgi:hypothetical protein